jgi:Lhr-like helicases
MVTPEQYKEFLRSLAEQDLIQLLGDGQLTLGKKGEKLTGHYNFYTAFTTVVEYRLEHNGRSIGSIYRVDGLKENDNIVLSGRRWIIESILADRHLIRVKPAKGGKPPVYGGSPTLVHDRIRREMRMLYADPGDLSFLDTVARRHVAEGARYFSELGLAESCFLQKGRSVLVLPWRGDRMIYALCGLLRIRRLNVAEKSGIVDISDIDVDGCMKVLRDIVSGDRLTANQLAKHVDRIENEKHDRYVPRSLLEHDYGARFLDVDGAYTWICELVGT